jgi:hypothetical protein
LPSDENLYVLRGKKRPAIVLQTVVTDYYSKLYPEPYVWVALSFTVKPRHKLDYRCQVAAMKRDHLSGKILDQEIEDTIQAYGERRPLMERSVLGNPTSWCAGRPGPKGIELGV